MYLKGLSSFQLQHTLSKKRLMVNTTKTSRIEATNLQVELSEEVTEGCIFTVLPRYKVRSVGDEVSHKPCVVYHVTSSWLACLGPLQ